MLDEREKEHILKRFNAFANTNLQNMYLKGFIVQKDVKRVGSQGKTIK